MSGERKSWLLGWRGYLGKVNRVMMAYFGLGGILNFRMCHFRFFCGRDAMLSNQGDRCGHRSVDLLGIRNDKCPMLWMGFGKSGSTEGVVMSWQDNWQARVQALGNQAQSRQDSSLTSSLRD
jgi:hypothetical protein